MYRFVKILVILAFMAILGLVGMIVGFMIYNDAPVIHGDLELNLHYKGDKHLDLYQPTIQVYEKSPVVLYFHGGAWMIGRKESINNARFHGAINTLREEGYAVVSPEYALATEDKSPFPDCVIDAYDAADWILANAETYNFDVDNIGVMGESAGAHLALMAGFDDSRHNAKINYIVDVYGPTNLYTLYQQQIPFIDTIKAQIPFLGDMDIPKMLFGFDPEVEVDSAKALALANSPVQFIRPSSPPILIIHGNQDRVVPISQSEVLIDYLDSFDVKYEFHILDSVDHAFRGASEDQKAKTQEWISEFVMDNYVQIN